MKRAVMLLLMGSMLGACGPNRREVRLDSTLSLYENAIRWGRYPEVFALQEVQTTAPDFSYLREIRVTAYEPLGDPVVSEQGNRVEQSVEIRFYHEQYGRERMVIDKQRWHYDEAHEVWLREGSMPDFRSATR